MTEQQPLVDVEPAADLTPGTPPPAGVDLPPISEWEVIEWALPGQPDVPVYRLHAGGRVFPLGDPPRFTLSAARAAELVADGALVPVRVSALAPLLREISQFRTHAVITEGETACYEAQCEHVDDEDGTQLVPCPVRLTIATAVEAVRLRRIARLVEVRPASYDDDTEELKTLRGLIDDIQRITDGNGDNDSA